LSIRTDRRPFARSERSSHFPTPVTARGSRKAGQILSDKLNCHPCQAMSLCVRQENAMAANAPAKTPVRPLGRPANRFVRISVCKSST
jgi:hypothetical protein